MISYHEGIVMVGVPVENQELYETTLAKINALCKGLLLVGDKSKVKATSFCRGLLILLEQLFEIIDNKTQT